MNYLVLVKTVVDDNGKRNVIEKIPYDGEVSLKSAYELIGCEIIDIKEVPFHAIPLSDVIVFLPKMTFIFDDEFLLKHSKPVANEIASLAFGYGRLTISACVETCCFARRTKRAKTSRLMKFMQMRL